MEFSGRQLLTLRAAILVLKGKMPIQTFRLYVDGYGKYLFTAEAPYPISGIYTNNGRRVSESPGGGFLSLTPAPAAYDITDIARILCPYSVDATNNIPAFISAITLYMDTLYHGQRTGSEG